MRWSALVFLVGVLAATVRADTAAPSLTALIGTPAQPWQVMHWTNSRPLALSELRGRVVLVRWWTAPDCPFCAVTSTSLNELHQRYASRGLTVIGMYHHKASSPLQPDDVEHYAKLFKFEFPVAIDPGWKTLRSWWPSRGPRDFTSLTFLIDRRGVFRHIHPGGQYVKGDREYQTMQSMIEKLLSEAR